MKILQINSCCGCFSTGRIVSDLAKAIETAGHDCVVAYGRDFVDTGIKTIKICNKAEILINTIISRLFDRTGFGLKRATKKFIKQVKEYNPDIIHLHNLHGDYINIEVLFEYLAEADKPVVWTMHDCWAITGHCAHFESVNCDRWREQCFLCPQKKNYPKSYLVDRSKRNYEIKKELFTKIKKMVIVTPSQWLANIIKQSFLSEYPITVINNGIDLNIFNPTTSDFRLRYNLINKIIILGIASSWSQKKGLNDFIKLSKRLDSNYTIVLIGLTKKQLKSIPNNILGFEKTKNIKELVEIYSTADIMLNLTYEDTFPTINLESLACGTPVFTYNTGGSPEVINNKCGMIIEQGDIECLIKEINNIKKFNIDDILSHAKHYNKINMFNKYIDIYNFLGESNEQ